MSISSVAPDHIRKHQNQKQQSKYFQPKPYHCPNPPVVPTHRSFQFRCVFLYNGPFAVSLHLQDATLLRNAGNLVCCDFTEKLLVSLQAFKADGFGQVSHICSRRPDDYYQLSLGFLDRRWDIRPDVKLLIFDAVTPGFGEDGRTAGVNRPSGSEYRELYGILADVRPINKITWWGLAPASTKYFHAPDHRCGCSTETIKRKLTLVGNSRPSASGRPPNSAV